MARVRFVELVLMSLVAAHGFAQADREGEEHTARLDITHGKPYVMVTIDGHGPFRFVIDTGTGGEAFITPQLVEQLGLPQTGHKRLSDPSGKGSQTVPTVTIPSLQLAGVTFGDVKAVVHDLSDADGPCEGLLGFPLFRDYLLTLDYPNHRMKLEPGGLTADGAQSVLPFRMPDGIPVVSMAVGETHFEALIDSGGTGLSVPETLAAKLKFQAAPVAFSNSHSIATRFLVRAGTLSADVHLGSYTFERPFVEVNPAFPIANFGSCPMQSFAITFDQRNGLVRFEGRRQVVRLSASPAPMRLTNSVRDKLPDPMLVPAG